MGAHPRHHFADVADAFLEVIVARAGEQRRVFIEQSDERGGRLQAILDDPMPYLPAEHRIAEDRFMDRENPRGVVANLAGDLDRHRAQLIPGLFARFLEQREFRRDIGCLQTLGVRIDKNFVDTVSRADGHSRRYGDSFTHGQESTKGQDR